MVTPGALPVPLGDINTMDGYDSDRNGIGQENGTPSPPFELPQMTVLVLAENRRLEEIDLSTFSPEEPAPPPAYPSLDDDTLTVAVSGDARRVSLHPLGPLDRPAGVAPEFWDTLDTEGLVPRGRRFVLRNELDQTTQKIPKALRHEVHIRHPGTRLPVKSKPQVGQESSVEEEEPRDPSEMPFLDHLEEFRWALLKSVSTIGISMIIGWFLSDYFYKTLTSLSNKAELPLIFTQVMEPIMIKLQMALLIGIFISVPFVFYFVWSFVAPGLYRYERKWILPLVFGATACFFIGASIAYFIIIPYMLQFMKAFMPEDISPLITVSNFLSVMLKFTLLFGVIFEMPLVTFVFARIGILKHTFMSKYRGYAIITIFLLGAILTPPDPMSQIVMAGPLILLYEFSIIIARIAGKKTLI
ncbi:twin-arginine translocase subunit TatC [Candidatus Latescibacterota bacterium]